MVRSGWTRVRGNMVAGGGFLVQLLHPFLICCNSWDPGLILLWSRFPLRLLCALIRPTSQGPL